MEEENTNIYALYEINNDAENIIWYYDNMPTYIEWIGRDSVIPFEKYESKNWSKREHFSCKIDFKEDSINYLNKYFKTLLEKKTINRFILSDTSKPLDL